jgi:hypothetical protein
MGDQEEKVIEVDEARLIEVTEALMDFCQEREFDELISYMAMVTITKAMEETLGFSNKRKINA